MTFSALADTDLRVHPLNLGGKLRTDRIDLYYAHQDDPDTDQLAVAQAFDALVTDGKIRCLGASNFSLDRLSAAGRR